jgi:hypothetical protein
MRVGVRSASIPVLVVPAAARNGASVRPPLVRRLRFRRDRESLEALSEGVVRDVVPEAVEGIVDLPRSRERGSDVRENVFRPDRLHELRSLEQARGLVASATEQ